MKASVATVKTTSINFGEYVVSVLTLIVINAIVIVPAALIIREFLVSIG